MKVLSKFRKNNITLALHKWWPIMHRTSKFGGEIIKREKVNIDPTRSAVEVL